jgi:Large polyvalent protein associated domain 22
MAESFNEFDDAAASVVQGQATAIRSNLYNAVPQNPANVAEHARIAKGLGIPLESVQSDVPTAKQQAAMQSFDADKVVTQYPHLAQFLTDPTNAAKSHNDLTTLAATEQSVKNLPKLRPAATTSLEGEDTGVGAWLSSNAKSVVDLPLAATQGFGYSFNRAGRAVDLALGAFPVMYDKAASLITGKDTYNAQDAYFKRFVQPLDDDANAFQLSPNATFLEKLTHGLGGFVGTLSQIAMTGGTAEAPAAIDAAAPALTKVAEAVAHATRTMAFPSITAAVNTGNDVYAHTGSLAAAVKAASTAYATNTAMGVLPLSLEGSALTRVATGFPIGALTGEVNRQVSNASLPGGMQQPAGVEEAIINGLTGSMLAGTMGVKPAPHEVALRDNYEAAQKATQAEQGMQALQALGELAGASELRKHDAPAFRDFVRQVTEDGHLPEVWVDGETLAQAFKQSGVSLEELSKTMPGVAAQLHETSQTGGDVRIPTEDFATSIAGGPLEKVLLPHLKIDPDGMTFQQGQEHMTQQSADMQKQAKDLVEQTVAVDERQQQLKTITTDVQSQLEATGRYPADVAKQYASMHGAFYDNMAERMGISPADMRARMPLRIRGEGAGGFNQGVEGVGPFGPVSHDFHHDATGAIAHLMQEKKGEAVEAFVHPELGPIAFVYGNDHFGLRHIEAKHGAESLERIPSILENGRVVKDVNGLPRAYIVEDGDPAHVAVVRLDWDGEQKTWLVTSYPESRGKFKKSVAAGNTPRDGTWGATDTPNATDVDSVAKAVQEYKQGDRGSYNPATGEMGLLKDADLSTFLHESGHFFLESIHDLANSEAAPDAIKSDFDTLLKSFGVEGDTAEDRLLNWSNRDIEGKRDGHEKFAEDFESYLMTGKAPVPELQSMFSRFRSWLMSVYQSMRNDVSPEVRGVMDRMFASEQAINDAEKVRAYAVPDLPGEAGPLIDEYKALGKEATEQAISDMQARSMRDLKWASNAKNKVIKDLQREAAGLRREARIDATREVMTQPVYRAWTFLTAKDGEKVVGEKVKGQSRGVNPETDNLFEAIAKLGGLDRAEVLSAWGIDAKEKMESGIFGKPVVRKSGGKSMHHMAELLAEEGYLIPHEHTQPHEQLEALFDDQRRGVDRYSIQRDMQSAYGDKPAPNLPELGFGKLRTEDLRTMYGDKPDAVWRKVSERRMTSDVDGLHPDIVAEMFGMQSGRDLVQELATVEHPGTVIEGRTDQLMLERHGDLVDPVSVERAAEAAIHNEVRAKMMATGLKMFTKSPMSAIEINKAAKAAADTAVAQKVVGELRPAQYSAAETKANKALLKLAPKDPMGAAKAQREALLNNRLFKSASEAVADVRTGLTYLKRLQKPSVRGKIDIDVRDQIDELLARFDLRANPSDAPTRSQLNLEKWIESQAAAGYSPTITPDMLAQDFRKPYRELTVEQFRGMVDTVRSMEHMGKDRNTLSINGEKQSLHDFVRDQLVPKLQERGDRFSVDEIYSKVEERGVGPVAIALDHLTSWMRGLNAQLKPQEYKRNDYDRHELLGPFGKAVFDPVIDANYNKVRMLKGLSDDFRVKAVELGKEWQDSLLEMLPNARLVDAIATREAGQPVYMKMTRGKMVGLAVHVGNESNFDKLTKGYGWKPEAVWQYLHDNMTAKDWDAVQHVWDLYEKHWPDMQAMYRRLGQTTPDKIEPRAFHTPFGEMRGGYAAIKYDPLRSRKGERDAAGAAINPGEGLFGRDYFSRTATTNGSMNKRIDGYTDAIDLNFHTIERSMQESIHDLAYREALINTNKIIEHSDFRNAFFKAYGREDYAALQDWIGRIANAGNADNAVDQVGRFMQYTRTGMVMTAIALRATTVLKHGGSAGIKTMGYFGGGGEKYLAHRFAAMGNDYTNQIAQAKEKFGEINARLLQQDRDYRATATSMFEPESLRGKGERFGHSAVAWADMMTAVPTAWAAYDRAITEGVPVKMGGTGLPMTEAQAVAYANKIVREAHGSNVESARSNVMTAPSEGVKLFTTLYGFMNNSYGQMADSVNKLQTPGIAKPEVLARTLMAIIVPALWAELISEGLPHKLDSAGEWALWSAKAITGEVAGMVPVVRDAWSMAKGFSHAGVVGAESWMSTMVNAGRDVVHLAQGKEVKKPIQDISDAVGMGLHIPGLGQLGKSAQYMADVHNGKQHPEHAGQYIKGVLVGPPKKE